MHTSSYIEVSFDVYIDVCFVQQCTYRTLKYIQMQAALPLQGPAHWLHLQLHPAIMSSNVQLWQTNMSLERSGTCAPSAVARGTACRAATHA